MLKITPQELRFIEELGLMTEKSGGAKTLGRIFAYLLLADKPKTLDEIATELLFSKATASLTIRQGLMIRFFEKVSIPGERKDYYRVNAQSWINTMSEKINGLSEWEELINFGLSFLSPDNLTALENLEGIKDYFDFMRWYFSDFTEQYQRWKKGYINRNT